MLRRFDEDRGSINRHLPQAGLTDDVRRTSLDPFRYASMATLPERRIAGTWISFFADRTAAWHRARIAVPDINVTVIDDRQ